MSDVNVLVVIDTDGIKRDYPNLSKDSNKPTGLPHNYQYMICTGARAVAQQASADLEFSANVGDDVSFTGVSISNNSEDAVIVYDIEHWKGDSVFNRFVPDLITRNGAVMPDPNTDKGLPPVQAKTNFSTFDSKVRSGGTEYFYVYIALYTLSADGESQDLHGYCYWDPAIKVA